MEITDGASMGSCATGGGSYVVVCTDVGGVWTGTTATTGTLPLLSISGSVLSGPFSVLGALNGTSASFRNLASIGPRYDVTQFGAVGKENHTTGTINASSNSLTGVSNITAWVVGQGISVYGAGPSGTNLVTTITAINAGTFTITLAGTASVHVSGAAVYSDDTAAIQAAFTACYNNGTGAYGGVVEFPGPHAYVISGTINAYDSCQIEGVTAGDGLDIGAQNPVTILWNGPAMGSSFPLTSVSPSLNTGMMPVKTPSSPNTAQASIVTVSASNSLAYGDWVLLSGCATTPGRQVNNLVGQVGGTPSSSSFTITASETFPETMGPYTDSCSVTPINVAIAFDSIARYQQSISNILIEEAASLPSANDLGVDIYYGSRVDSGTKIRNVWASGHPYFAYYFSNGGIDIDFADGWRSDAIAKTAQVYFRGAGGGFQMFSGSLSSGSSPAAANLMIDNEACEGNKMRAGLYNTTFEADSNFLPGYGAIMLLDCPSVYTYPQFTFTIDGGGVYCSTGNSNGSNCPAIVMQPSNDTALILDMSNTIAGVGPGANNTPTFVGIPSLLRGNLTGSSGFISHLSYSPAFLSLGATGSPGDSIALSQAQTDFGFKNLWQDGIQASALLYSDTAYAALPNGTTLQVGQVLAPPSYWSSTSSEQRYALDVVKQAGTTGVPNFGLTTCTETGTYQLTCAGPSASITATSACSSNTLTVTTSALSTGSWGAGEQVLISGTGESFLNGGTFVILSGGTSTSFSIYAPCGSFGGNTGEPAAAKALVSSTADLGYGQHISIGSVSNIQISSIDATSPGAVVLGVSGNVSTVPPGATLNYSAPMLNLEIQLPTKSSAAPTSAGWSPGDIEQNSGAAANGVAAWVNVGTGTWAGVPLGNSTGQIVPSQIAEIKGVATLASGTATVTNGAACTPSATCVYKLTNCGKGSSTGIGTPEIGTVSVGTSFVINSLGPTASVLTTDLSTVCWQIN